MFSKTFALSLELEFVCSFLQDGKDFGLDGRYSLDACDVLIRSHDLKLDMCMQLLHKTDELAVYRVLGFSSTINIPPYSCHTNFTACAAAETEQF